MLSKVGIAVLLITSITAKSTRSVESTRGLESARVAIVGGGISGAATAYFLGTAHPALTIDVYEALDDVGGRARTLDASEFGVPLDAGATAIFSRNEYLTAFIDAFRIEKAPSSGDESIGVWDGDAFRFHWPDGPMLPARIIERYGASPVALIKEISDTVDKLCRVYEMQANGSSWTSPQALFDALELTALTQTSAYDRFEKVLGVSSAFVTEFVDGASRDNYSQDGAISAFVDLVSLAGAGIGGSVFSLANGTTQIARALLSSPRNGSTRLGARVSRIEATQDDARPGFRVTWTDGGPPPAHTQRGADDGQPNAPSSARYDALALATPLEVARGLTLVGMPAALNSSRPYQRTCVTFVNGELSPAYFGDGSEGLAHAGRGSAPGPRGAATPLPTVILTVENASVPFTTVELEAKLANGSSVYKVFSRRPLSDETLDVLFLTRRRTRRIDWTAAYTKLLPAPTSEWPPFDVALGDGGRPLLYVAAMESAVSCMETQIISAKNAALRIAEQLGLR